jgi:hypothetical protein
MLIPFPNNKMFVLMFFIKDQARWATLCNYPLNVLDVTLTDKGRHFINDFSMFRLLPTYSPLRYQIIIPGEGRSVLGMP